jgi:hypothetical protein
VLKPTHRAWTTLSAIVTCKMTWAYTVTSQVTARTVAQRKGREAGSAGGSPSCDARANGQMGVPIDAMPRIVHYVVIEIPHRQERLYLSPRQRQSGGCIS